MSAPVTAKTRFLGIDLVKILACFLVVCIHFFLYTGFYSEPITETFGQSAITFRWVAYCCVPLFMITTGYLMKNKTLSKGYYLGIIRVLVLYLIISVICIVFNIHHFNRVYTAWDILKGMFVFTNAQYAWYVEYYITLFLLIPFLNSAFNGMKNLKHKLVLTLTVFALTMVSQSLYVGTVRDTQFRLLPGYFLRCYPIAYYFIGAFIRDWKPKTTVANKMIYALIYVVSLAWLSTTTFQQSLDNAENNFVMMSWHYNDYGSWPVAICSTMLFLILYDIRCSNSIILRIVKFISESTFACYLISYVFDSIFYAKLAGKYPTTIERFQHIPMQVLRVFGCSIACGMLLQGLYNICEALIKYMINRKKQSKLTPKTEPAAVTAAAAETVEAAEPSDTGSN